MPTRRLLLISSSRTPGSGFLDHCRGEIRRLLGSSPKSVLFLPYAQHDHDAYARLASKPFEQLGYPGPSWKINGTSACPDMRAAATDSSRTSGERKLTPRIIRASGRGDYYFDPFNEIATETNNFVNLNVRLDAPSWSVGLWGRNVGDVRHATNISIGSSNRNRVQNRPRSFGLEATYRFQHNADGFALLRESQFHAVCPEISIDVRIGFNSSLIRGLDALKAFTK